MKRQAVSRSAASSNRAISASSSISAQGRTRRRRRARALALRQRLAGRTLGHHPMPRRFAQRRREFAQQRRRADANVGIVAVEQRLDLERRRLAAQRAGDRRVPGEAAVRFLSRRQKGVGRRAAAVLEDPADAALVRRLGEQKQQPLGRHLHVVFRAHFRTPSPSAVSPPAAPRGEIQSHQRST